jgi:hypothetical protein
MNADVVTNAAEWVRSKRDVHCVVRHGFSFSVIPTPRGDFALSIVRPGMVGLQIDCLAETFASEADAIARAELLISLERIL